MTDETDEDEAGLPDTDPGLEATVRIVRTLLAEDDRL